MAIYDEELPKQEAVSSQRRCCFSIPCMHCHHLTFSVGSNWWETITDDDGKAGNNDDDNRCWSKGTLPFRKIKEWSQLVVVPKFKTFIRRFNTEQQRSTHGKFRYDPTSYMLNFDEGLGCLEDDNQAIPKFATRYSSILVPVKPSMNLGGLGLTCQRVNS
ncbi:hypothetical protein SSX86_018908 [Deinandra increscens subsp. villosa]|uniref:Uncharacterized protein n=1 Tax=Deinandra increscens subsp. villosa TaxID=3103831 RepID=A0AAP0GWR1_9ASTR